MRIPNLPLSIPLGSLASLVLAGVVSATAGCSQGSPTNDGAIRVAQFQVINPSAPIHADAQHQGEDFAEWEITRADNRITFRPAGASTSQTLTFAGVARVLAATTWTDYGSGQDWLLVGTIDSSSLWSCWRLGDTNGDRVPDMSSKALLFSSGATPMFITRIARRGRTGTAYLLDRRCQNIWIATDANGDGFPDQISPVPFAQSATIPELLDATCHFVDSAGDVYFPSDGAYRLVGDMGSAAELFAGTELHRLIDTTGNGVADSVTTGMPNVGVPVWSIRPYAGQTGIGLSGPTGLTAQIYELADDDELGQLLGSASTTSGATTTVTLTRALVAGERIHIRFSGSALLAAYLTVLPAWPQVADVSPPAVDLQGGSITVAGANLTGTTVFRLVMKNDSTQALVLGASVTSPTQATVAIPVLAPAWLGTQYLSVHDPAIPASIGESVTNFGIGDTSGN